MSDDVAVAVRRLVSERAAGRCEYCLLLNKKRKKIYKK